MIVSKAINQMIYFYQGNLHDVNHFLKVWGYAKTIGEMEKLDSKTQKILELSAVVHDIAIPLCREKYGNAAGPYQELEGPALVREFYKEYDLTQEEVERICYLVGHHHTTDQVDGSDYQILLEADFLVNAHEGNLPKDAIVSFRDKVFKTKTGTDLLNDMYQLV